MLLSILMFKLAFVFATTHCPGHTSPLMILHCATLFHAYFRVYNHTRLQVGVGSTVNVTDAIAGLDDSTTADAIVDLYVWSTEVFTQLCPNCWGPSSLSCA